MAITKTQVEKIKAEGAAYGLAREYYLDTAGPVPIEDIAMDKGVLCIDAPLNGCLARLLRRGEKGIIRVRADIAESGRRRFAIGHELGHWFLHAAYSQYFICTAENMRDYTKSPLEIEANLFASELLMPTGVFRPLVANAEPSWSGISDLAALFDTSLTATAIRFANFCKAECAVAQSTATGIQWLKPRDMKCNLVFRRSGPLHEESLAYHALRERRSLEPDEVPVEAWIVETFADRNVTIVEEAIYVERYKTALSLLTIIDADPSTPDARDRMWRAR